MNDGNYDVLLEENKVIPKVLIFGKTDQPNMIHKAIVANFGDKMDVYFIKTTEKNLERKFNVSKRPSILVR